MAPLSNDERNRAAAHTSIGVIGAGAWGTALAIVAAGNAEKVLLWAREPEVVESVSARRENTLFMPGVRLPGAIQATAALSDIGGADALLLVTPAQHMRATLAGLRGIVKPHTPVIICAKGIETGSGLLLNEVLEEALPQAEPAILSGPSFARDVARGLPTAVTIAARESVAVRLQASLSQSWLRPYVTEDVRGVALGGAAKNVYAIACGMVEGAGFGESARAAVISRGFAELLRLGAVLGARSETLMGLSGLGDLVLTATSMSSRNFSLGVALGKGARLDEASGPGRPLAEGAATAPALVARASRHGIELPIAEAVADVLAGRLQVREAAERLLSRPLKSE